MSTITITFWVYIVILSIIHFIQIDKKDKEIKRLNELLRKKDSVFICMAHYEYSGGIHHHVEKFISGNELEAKKGFLAKLTDIEKFRTSEVTVFNAVATLN